MLRRTFFGATFLACMLVAPTTRAVAADDYIDASASFVRTLADKAITTLTNPELSAEDRRQHFRELFNESFAVKGIALYVLGRYRKRATEAELAEYLALFEDVIVNTWADRFTEYAGQKFEVDSAVDTPSPSKSEKAALVRSTFYPDPTSPVEIEWRVASNGSIFKIVDVKVSGLSLAKTQQDEFGSVIRANGDKVSALIDKLREMRDS
jgi:phospholipid transport system substrate-binding protein